MHYINGLWVEGGSHRFTSLNPATGKELWSGLAAGEAEIRFAVEIAREKSIEWAGLSYEERYHIAERFKQRIEASKDTLATLIAEETGKVMWDAKSEVAAVISKLAYADEAYKERTGLKTRTIPGATSVISHRPHGVMAVYGPYNFPAHLPNVHIMPALLAGNTVVFKPSEHTPAVAEWLVTQWIEAGIPPGVLNLVQGERDTGILLAQQSVNGLLFTGSSATGKALHAQFAGRPEVILALEMGGNNPLIVSKVSDLRPAILETLLSAFTGSGQRCTCARRLIVIENENTEQFISQLVTSAEALVVGAYTDEPPPFMGPLISNREADRLLDAQAHLETLGGKVLLRMRRLKQGLPFVSPAIIEMTCVNNVPDVEYFGPLLQLYRVKTGAQAVALANATSFGLSASILCDDPTEYQLLSKDIHAGMINWNRQTTGASGAAPFGGVGVSGNHRPAGYYSADYCAYPVASVEVEALALPQQLPPGIILGE